MEHQKISDSKRLRLAEGHTSFQKENSAREHEWELGRQKLDGSRIALEEKWVQLGKEKKKSATRGLQVKNNVRKSHNC